MIRKKFIAQVVTKYVSDGENQIKEGKGMRGSMLMKALKEEEEITNVLLKLHLVLKHQFDLEEDAARELTSLFGSNLVIFAEAARLDEQELLQEKEKVVSKWQVVPELKQQEKKEVKKKRKINKKEFENVVKLMSDKYATKKEKEVLNNILKRL